MNLTIKQQPTTLELHRSSFHRALNIQPGTTVVCEKGLLWLTQPEDYKDYMLKPGEKMTISKRHGVLIEALSEAGLRIVYPH